VSPQIHILQFARTLRWLDGKPLLETMEPYRQRILTEAIDAWDDEQNRPMYNAVLTGRGKKCWKTFDGILAGLHRLMTWKTSHGNDCRVVSFDIEQAGECLDLLKKFIRKNPPLSQRLTIKTDGVYRKDGLGDLRILSGRDIYGQHGKSYLFLHVNELQTQRDYALLEGLALDPHRTDSLQWFESYDTLLRRPGVPMYDMVQRGKAGTDKRFYFSWYASDYCTDPDFASKHSACERANPSLVFVNGYNEYIETQRLRLPGHLFRRLHENVGGQPQGAAFAAESILASIAQGVTVRPPVSGLDYHAAVDMSDGSNDDATLAIGHIDHESRVIVDLVTNQQAKCPFDPLRCVKLFAETLVPYRVTQVTLDRFAHNTFASAFSQHKVTAVLSELTTHQTYEAFGPRLNSGQIVLLDNADLQNQFLGLLWRGARIDHANNEHDDHAAAVARLASILQGEVDLTAFFEANRLAPARAFDRTRDWLDQDASDSLHPIDNWLDRCRWGWEL
jgi:hypothetical protein